MLKSDYQDSDPAETADWLDSLEAVLQTGGPERAQYLLTRLRDWAGKHGVEVPFSANTPYVNTIHADQQPPYPGGNTQLLLLSASGAGHCAP